MPVQLPAESHSDQEASSEIQYRLATTRADREKAFRLVHRAYVRAGLTLPNPYGMHVTPYQLLRSTEIFIAEIKEEVISTLSLVIDAEMGLPMEELYPEEVKGLRERGIRVAEVSCLADRRGDIRRTFQIFVKLCRLMAQRARQWDVQQLLIIVHPRHARFYQRYMYFEPIAGQKSHPKVLGNPAVALALDFEKADRERPPCYDNFFGVSVLPPSVPLASMPPADRAYFRDAATCYGQFTPSAPRFSSQASASLPMVNLAPVL